MEVTTAIPNSICSLLTGKGSGVTEDVSLQTNGAYCTVTTGVPMKRNEAYETVLRPETDTLSPVYDIVH